MTIKGTLQAGSKAANLSDKEKKFINERYNKTGKPFAEWWVSLTNEDRFNKMSAFKRFEKSAKAIKKLRDKGLIPSAELDELLDKAGRKFGTYKDLLKRKDPAYMVLKPRVVTGIYASETQAPGKVRDTWFKKPNAKQIRAIVNRHSASLGTAGGMQFKTMQAVKNLHKDTKFVKLLATYEDGDDISDKVIKKIFKGEFNPYVIQRYSAVLNGDEVIPGIAINKALAKKLDEGIDFSVKGSGWRGKIHQAARNKAIRKFDNIFNPNKNPEQSFLNRQREIQKLLKKYGLKGLSVDEVLAIRTAGTAGQTPYSIFSQIIKNKANTQTKVEIDAATAVRANKLEKAIKANDLVAIEEIREGQRNHVKNFRLRNPEFKNINLPEDFRVGESPMKVLGEERFKTLPVEARKAMKESFKKTQFTPDLGKNLLTQKELLIKLAGTNANNVCSIFQKGGRMRFAEGTGCAGQMAQALDEDPIGTATKAKNITGTGGAVNRVKNAATSFLKFAGKGKAFGATAAVGALGSALVKQFRNDDPTTYLTDDKQANAMILDTLEIEKQKERQRAVGDAPELLDEAAIGAELGVAAAAVPGSKKLFEARKKKGFGAARAALGPAGKALSGFATPLGIAATTPLNVARQVYEGESVEDIVTDPLNYLGPAFAGTLTREATRGMSPTSTLSKALRLGMNPATIRTASKFFGLPGLALSLGYEGYDQYKKYTEGRGFVYNLLNRDRE